MKPPAAFIDRDGVINEERNYVHRREDFILLPGVCSGLRKLQAAGFSLIVVTNQAGIARGLYSETDFQNLTQYMREVLLAQGISLTAVYHCPHHPEYGRETLACDCRKPAPGLLLRARDELGIELAQSVLVGDKGSDIEAGRAADLKYCVQVLSGHPVQADDCANADACCRNLEEAANWILTRT